MVVDPALHKPHVLSCGGDFWFSFNYYFDNLVCVCVFCVQVSTVLGWAAAAAAASTCAQPARRLSDSRGKSILTRRLYSPCVKTTSCTMTGNWRLWLQVSLGYNGDLFTTAASIRPRTRRQWSQPWSSPFAQNYRLLLNANASLLTHTLLFPRRLPALFSYWFA